MTQFLDPAKVKLFQSFKDRGSQLNLQIQA